VKKNNRKRVSVFCGTARRPVNIAIAAILCLFMARDASAIGQTAVVTLGFPVGARPTAMGEAFTGLANDANAIFYNPAGLGQSPLTLSWKTHLGDSAFTAVAAKSAAAFGARNYVWAGTNSGVTRFNGKIWEKGETYLPEEHESLRSVTLRYFDTDDKSVIDEAVWEIRKENNLGMKRYEQLVLLLESQAGLFKDDSVPFDPKAYAKMLVLLPSDEMISGYLQDHVLPQSIEATTRKDLANNIVTVMEIEDRNIGDVVELSIPFTVAIRDTVTALTLDASERLWVGTASGLWQYHNSKWRRYSAEHLSGKITSISVSASGAVAVGTEHGLAITSDATDTDWKEGVFLKGAGGSLDGFTAPPPLTLNRAEETPEAAETVVTESAEPAESAELTESIELIREYLTDNKPADSAEPTESSELAESVEPAELGAQNPEPEPTTEPAAQEASAVAGRDGLPDSYITSVAYLGEQLYVGTPRGLAKVSDYEVVEVFDTASGLLSLGVTALFSDSKGQLWIGGENGITIYSGTRNWKRYKFPGSAVYSFAEQSSGTMWIGTNKGVITHRAGKAVTGKDGKTTAAPEWKTYHSKNALKSDNISAIAACGKDMWVATDAALHQYANAETQVMLFYEQILPSFKMTDLWHAFPAIVIPTEDWGTLGFSINFINMGDNEQFDDWDKYMGRARAWEGIFGISYGFPVKEDLSLGLNAKYVCSVLDNLNGGVGQTFAIDAGILKRNLFIDRLDAGFMLQNMGPSIYYMTPADADPIPFSLRLGLAYKPVRTPFHELTFVADAYREVAKNYYDKKPDPFWVALWTDMLHDTSSSFKEEVQEINVSLGAEYMYADFMALRAGFLGDYLGERFEFTMGLGIKYANMNFDFSYVFSPEGFMGRSSGARDGQWRLSVLLGL